MSALLAWILAAGLAPEVAYEQAWALEQAEAPEEAVVRFERLASQHPEHALAPEAVWDAARISLDELAQPRRAVRLLGMLKSRWPRSRPAQRARFQLEELMELEDAGLDGMIARLALNTNDPEALVRFEKRWPEHPHLFWVRLRRADFAPLDAARGLLTELGHVPHLGYLAIWQLAAREWRAGNLFAAWRLWARGEFEDRARWARNKLIKRYGPWILGLAALGGTLLWRRRRRRREVDEQTLEASRAS